MSKETLMRNFKKEELAGQVLELEEKVAKLDKVIAANGKQLVERAKEIADLQNSIKANQHIIGNLNERLKRQSSDMDNTLADNKNKTARVEELVQLNTSLDNSLKEINERCHKLISLNSDYEASLDNLTTEKVLLESVIRKRDAEIKSLKISNITFIVAFIVIIILICCIA